MADRETELIARLAPGVAAIDAARLGPRSPASDPFLSHAFLSALEKSGSVGAGTGWTPAPIMIEDEAGALLAAAPAYLKTHSQGEYVFDHGWADAFERAGGQYYPKLQVAVPFTPVPGPRLLGHVPQQLLAAAEAVTVQNGLSSAHITFIDDAGAAECERARLADPRRHPISLAQPRLCRLRRVPRRADQPQAQGDPQGARRGARGPGIRRAARQRHRRRPNGTRCGPSTRTPAAANGAGPISPATSSTGSARAMGDRLLLFLAYRDGTPIAGALNFIGPDTLYGRYWGTIEEVPFLHFELSYYQAIEWAIEHGLSSVQAGAQGEHKLARGYEPVISRSAHFLADPGLRRAVADLSRRRAAGDRRRSRVGAAGAALPLLRPDRPPRVGRRRRPARGTSPAW